MQKRIKSITGKNELFRDGRYSNKNKDYTVYYDLVKPMSCQIFYIIGGSIAGLVVLGTFIIYLVKEKKVINILKESIS